ncbi:MAG: NADH-quinone oxidoreductase subunit L [Marmoricola sp.]
MTHALALAHAAAPVVHPAAASGAFDLLWVIIALPAFGAALLLLGGRRLERVAPWIGTCLVGASFVIAVIVFATDVGRGADQRAVQQHVWTWFTSGHWHVSIGLLFDQLSGLFVLLITGVGGLIHLYSVGYMAHDPRKKRFFAYMNLFVASMLMLVLASDYLGLFLGWEGVGLASYLLIGFWQHKHSAAFAAKKAFVVNRVGDIGLSLGVALIFATFGSTSFEVVSRHASGASTGALTAIGFLLLLAACGKSAQFPLHTWLLDAMEGPTPVSALIHAATMVTAGVYLITRSNFIFSAAPDARTGVMVVGCITLILGAIIGCGKDDIKKVLAGSTMSQIGYMILASGLGMVGYAFAIFHLLTHGFFKANMFLGAGSIMHSTNDDVDMRHYGALAKVMPVTFATFAVGFLAIIGFPGFSGFWSKDKIIESAFGVNWVAGLAALVGAGITAFYMSRLMFMTFVGKERWEPDVHPHESPKVMTIPLVLLAVGSAVGGLLYLGAWIVDWLSPVVGTHEETSFAIPSAWMSVLAVVVMAIGIAVAWYFFGRRSVPREAPTEVSFVTRAARAEVYGDAANEELVVKPTDQLVSGLTAFDRGVVDGAAMGTGWSFNGISGGLRMVQNGFVRSYALSLIAGAALVLIVLMVVNLR